MTGYHSESIIIKMAAILKENLVTYEDQQKINTFARTTTHLLELKQELTAKKKELENLMCAEEELLKWEADTNTVLYQIGEVLTELTLEEAQAELVKAKETCHTEISDLVQKAVGYKQAFSDLKTALHTRFGTSINLNLED